MAQSDTIPLLFPVYLLSSPCRLSYLSAYHPQHPSHTHFGYTFLTLSRVKTLSHSANSQSHIGSTCQLLSLQVSATSSNKQHIVKASIRSNIYPMQAYENPNHQRPITSRPPRSSPSPILVTMRH